jgi:hypothetical protein
VIQNLCYSDSRHPKRPGYRLMDRLRPNPFLSPRVSPRPGARIPLPPWQRGGEILRVEFCKRLPFHRASAVRLWRAQRALRCAIAGHSGSKAVSRGPQSLPKQWGRMVPGQRSRAVCYRCSRRGGILGVEFHKFCGKMVGCNFDAASVIDCYSDSAQEKRQQQASTSRTGIDVSLFLFVVGCR